MSKQGSSILQSLTAQYTDSEGEEDASDRPNDRKRRSSSLTSDDLAKSGSAPPDLTVWKEPSAGGAPSTASPSESIKSGTNTPQSGSSVSAAEIRRVAARLVSYNNDEAMSDDDNDDGSEEDSNSRVEFPVARASRPVSPDAEQLMPGEELLPPEPTGKCPPELQEKITRLYESMLHKRIDMNFSIQQRKQFRNPSIYEKLIDHLDIEEIGTNYPPELYDPYMWGEESYFENLSKLQRDEMDKREKERRERTKVEFVSGTAAKKVGPPGTAPSSGNVQSNSADEDKSKRRSKWDQAVPGAAAIPSGQSNVQFTSVPTGNKTAISAFGTLQKKAKPT